MAIDLMAAIVSCPHDVTSWCAGATRAHMVTFDPDTDM